MCSFLFINYKHIFLFPSMCLTVHFLLNTRNSFHVSPVQYLHATSQETQDTSDVTFQNAGSIQNHSRVQYNLKI